MIEISKAFLEFIAFFRKNLAFYAFGSAGLLLTNICELTMPKIIQWLIDLLVGRDQSVVPEFFHSNSLKDSMLLLAMLLFVNFLGAAVGGIVWRHGLFRMTHVSAIDVRLRFWRTLKDIGYISFLRRFSVGDLMNRLSQDYNHTRFMHGFTIVSTIDIVTVIGIALILMLAIDLQLSLYCLICFVVIPIFVPRLARKENRLHSHAQRELSTLSDLISQTVATVKLQRATGGENFWQEKLSESATEYAHRNYQTQKVSWQIFPFSALPVICSYTILCTLGIAKITNGELSLGEFFALAAYVLMLEGQLYQLHSCISQWQKGLASYERILEVSTSKIDNRKKSGEIHLQTPLLETRSLSYSYDGYQAIKFVSLKIIEGQWLGITGALGTGKTTILKCLAGLLPIADGRIFIFNCDINHLDNAIRSKLVAYVPQQVFMLSATLRENLSLDRDNSERELWQVLKIVQLQDFVAKLPQQLDTKIGEWGVDLSGGQKQRLAIARAVLRRPKLLLLDDCFSAIDSVTEKNIMQQVRIYLADTAIVWASHRTSSFHFCSKVMKLK